MSMCAAGCLQVKIVESHALGRWQSRSQLISSSVQFCVQKIDFVRIFVESFVVHDILAFLRDDISEPTVPSTNE